MTLLANYNDSDGVVIGHDDFVCRMPKDDFVRCLVARPKLVHACARGNAQTVTVVNYDCITPHACAQAINFASRGYFEFMLRYPGDPDVRCLESSFVYFEEAIAAGFDLCDICRGYYEQQDLAERQRNWKELPDYFDIEIPGWRTR